MLDLLPYIYLLSLALWVNEHGMNSEIKEEMPIRGKFIKYQKHGRPNLLTDYSLKADLTE